MRKTRLMVYGIIENGNQILLLKRKDDDVDSPGEWEIPGGKVEFGEHPKEAVLREMKEETNLKLNIKELFEIGNLQYDKTDRKIHLLRFYYLFKTKEKYVKISEKEHTEFKWVNKKDFSKYKIAEHMKKVFSKLKG